MCKDRDTPVIVAATGNSGSPANTATTGSDDEATKNPDLRLGMAWCERQQLLLSAGLWDRDPETTNFPVWEIALSPELCSQHLPQRLEYHKGYAKADAIWAPTARAAQLRKDISREFSSLWSRASTGSNRGSCSKKVKGSVAILSAINYGFRNGKPQVYSFVVSVDGRLRFCEAAAQVMHVTMSDAKPEVLFAGEFFFCSEAGVHSMCVTNNSGTFRPDTKSLEGVKNLFAALLCDIDVIAMDKDCPAIKDLTQRHKGDPVMMGHSIYHQQSVELREMAQKISASTLMGHAPVLQSPAQVSVCITPRRMMTPQRMQSWGGSPAGFVGCSAIYIGPPKKLHMSPKSCLPLSHSTSHPPRDNQYNPYLDTICLRPSRLLADNAKGISGKS